MEPIDFAVEVVQGAGKILMEYFGRELRRDIKRHADDYATDADYASEEFILSKVKAAFPDDKILSEENASQPENYMGRVWMVDPLDGTRAFVEGSDSFSVMIGLAIDGVPSFGITYAPMRDELYYAAKGEGAYLLKGGHTKQIHVSKVVSFADARLVDYRRLKEARDLDQYVDKLGLKVVAVEGTNTLKIGKIAQGIADVVINTNTAVSKWDFCAPQIILEEAGGKVTDINGDPIDYLSPGTDLHNSFVATNGLLHPVILGKLKEVRDL